MNRKRITELSPTQTAFFLSYQRHRVMMHALALWGYISLGVRGRHAKGFPKVGQAPLFRMKR